MFDALLKEHATGKKTWTANHKAIDSFPACVTLYRKAKDAATFLMAKKAKGRFVDYVKKWKLWDELV